MAVLSSKLAPGFIRIPYEGTRNPHHQIVPINFADEPTPGVNPTLLTAGGTPITAGAAILDYIAAVLAPNLATGTKFGAPVIYSVDAVTGVRQFIYTYNSVDLGENVNPTIPFSESVWVFKSTVGKPIKVYIMESVYDADQRNVGSVPADARQDVIDYMLSPDCINYGVSNAYPLAFMTFTSKINDVLRRNGGFTDI